MNSRNLLLNGYYNINSKLLEKKSQLIFIENYSYVYQRIDNLVYMSRIWKG